jgi:DNA-binding PadR family transcriptional regulator
MAKTNTTQYAILGLLCHQPQSGYDLKKMIDTSIRFFWNENYGHLYPILRRLEEAGLVTREVEKNRGRPDRNIFSITKTGKRALQAWLAAQPVDQPKRSELLLKLFFGNQANVQAMIPMIESKKRQSEELLGQLGGISGTISKQHGPDVPFWGITLSYGKHLAKAHLEWCDETLRTLHKLAPKEAL